MAVCTATHWAFNLMLAKSTPYMLKNITYGIYFVFAGCVSSLAGLPTFRIAVVDLFRSSAQTTLGAILEYFYMPETRGRSLEEMEHLFPGWQATKRMGSPRLGSSAIREPLEGEGVTSAGASTPESDINKDKKNDLHIESV